MESHFLISQLLTSSAFKASLRATSLATPSLASSHLHSISEEYLFPPSSELPLGISQPYPLLPVFVPVLLLTLDRELIQGLSDPGTQHSSWPRETKQVCHQLGIKQLKRNL